MDPQEARLRVRHLRQQQEKLQLRKQSRYTGLTLGAMVLSIYFYSMYKIKQETVLKDIDDEANS